MIAVLGANGQLGSDLVKVFGEEAIPLTHEDLDVTEPNTLEVIKELKPEVVVNTAAYVRVDDAEVEVEKALSVNAAGALNVARVCNEVKATNIYISTDYVFDGTKGEPYNEDDIPNPINAYGTSKYAGEIFTRNYSSRYYIARVSSLFGVAGASGKGGNFIETMIEKSKELSKLEGVNDTVITPTFTLDAAKKIKMLLDENYSIGTYHLANEGACTWYDFASAIFEILNTDTEIEPVTSKEFPSRANRPQNSALITKHNLENRNWREALKEYLRLKGYIE